MGNHCAGLSEKAPVSPPGTCPASAQSGHGPRRRRVHCTGGHYLRDRPQLGTTIAICVKQQIGEESFHVHTPVSNGCSSLRAHNNLVLMRYVHVFLKHRPAGIFSRTAVRLYRRSVATPAQLLCGRTTLHKPPSQLMCYFRLVERGHARFTPVRPFGGAATRTHAYDATRPGGGATPAPCTRWR